MARKKTGQKEVHWRTVLKRQAGSGLSIRQFCLREGISPPSFYAWRRKLRKGARGEPELRESRRRSDAPPDGREFISLRVVDAVSSLEVIHPRGCRIRVTGDVDRSALQRVLDVLDERQDA